ncbi:hypothetical protein ILUMI_18593 [Ignelater luminosus]|uniref:Uncharacterized protein n=1 Tax=Ignelater luminosus TaxID=2038154 RepID=A0A8K0G0R1_IGNLU|nr:hypothetical protein ILUMI_18593 [Ignelater luminosus]
MAFRSNIGLIILVISCFHSALSQSPSRSRLNPTIIQDSRDLPQTDGTFGFLYRTEDGIAHGAIGEPGGVIHGRYTYTDPTGLKVNFNYNAGTRTAPGYNYNQQPEPSRPSQPAYEEPQPAPQPRPRPRPSQPVYEYDDQPQYQPQSRPRPSQPEYDIPQPQHRLQPRPQPRPRPSQPRYNRPPAPQNNIDYGSYSETF